MKKFLDRLPGVVTAKPRGAKRHDATTYEVIARLLEAILHQRVVGMRYHSRRAGGKRTTSFTRIGWCMRKAACTCGRSCRRTGSCERSPSSASVASRSWKRRSRRSPSSTPTRSSTRWARTGAQRRERAGSRSASIPRIAPYIKERSWHPSQRLKDRTDGSRRDDDGRLRRLHASELDSQFRSRGPGAGARAARRMDFRGTGAGGAAVRMPARSCHRSTTRRSHRCRSRSSAWQRDEAGQRRSRPATSQKGAILAYAVCAAAAGSYPGFRQIMAVTSAATQPRYPSSFRRRK